MLLWFDKNGVLKEVLDYGATAKAGSQTFQIFAYFDLGDNYTDVYGSATIRFQRPDLEKTEYPTLMMTKSEIIFDSSKTDAGSSYSGKFVNTKKYIGYVFDFSSIRDQSSQSVVTLLDTPGIWEATITLINNDAGYGINNVVGLVTFNVEGSVISEDDEPTELTYDVLLTNIATSIAVKVDKDANYYVRLHEDFETAAKNGTLIKNVFVEGTYVLDKKTNYIFQIKSVSESSTSGYVSAQYKRVSLDGAGAGLNIVELDVNKFVEGSEIETQISTETKALIKFNANDIFKVKELKEADDTTYSADEYLYFWLSSLTGSKYSRQCVKNNKVYILTLDNNGNSLKGTLTSYYTSKETNDLLSTIKKNAFKVVDSKPETGEEGIVYLVKTTKDGVYEQYIYESENWISLGTTELDLSNYYSKTEIDNKISDLESKINTKQDALSAGRGIKIENGDISTILEYNEITINLED